MKTLISIITLILLSIQTFGQSKFEIRAGIEFGMTLEQVKELETAEFQRSVDDGIIYIVSEDEEKEIRVLYSFEENKLESVSFLYIYSPKAGLQALDLHEELVAYLNSTYGDPDTQEVKYEDEKYKDDPDAFEKGMEKFETWWEPEEENMTIGVTLYGKDNQTKIFLSYSILE